MRKIKEVLIRSAMLFLAMSPIPVLLAYFTSINLLVYPATMFVMILAVGFVSLCPPYIGNYKVEESVVMHSKHSGPDPDKEYEHVIEKSGHRFPLRAVLLVILLIAMPVLYLVLPNPILKDSWSMMLVPALVLLVISIFAAVDFVRTDSMFTEMQGILTGTVIHVVAAIFLHFVNKVDAAPGIVGGIFTSLFMIVSFFMMNGHSLLMSVNSEKQAAPAKIRKKNRLISVLVIIAVFAVSSFKYLRQGAEWLFNKVTYYVWIAVNWLTELFMGGQMGGLEGAGGDIGLPEELVEEAESKPTPKFVEYIMIGIAVAAMLALLFLLCKQIVRLIKKLLDSLNTSEGVTGYVDETEEIRPDDREGSALANRLKSLFSREKPWNKLDGRERVRRVMQRVLRRSKEDLSCMTANEARGHVDIRQADADEFFAVYDEARYSSHEIGTEKGDSFKKAAGV